MSNKEAGNVEVRIFNFKIRYSLFKIHSGFYV